MWDDHKNGFRAYLQLEKSLSPNSIEAYLHDIEKLLQFLQLNKNLKAPGEIELKDLQQFVKWIARLDMTASSQARIISGLKAFYKYCLIEDIVKKDPSLLLEAPRTKRALPDVLSFEEIECLPVPSSQVRVPESGSCKS